MPRPNHDTKVRPKPFFTTGDLSRIFQVSFKTVHGWIARGELPSFRLPGPGQRSVRFLYHDVMAFIQKTGLPPVGLVEGPAPPPLREPEDRRPGDDGNGSATVAGTAQAAPACRELPCQDVYTTVEVANLLGLRKGQVQSMFDRGAILGYRAPNGDRRIPRQCLIAFLMAKNLPLDLLNPNPTEKQLCTNPTPAIPSSQP
jgi:hypothetical protein